MANDNDNFEVLLLPVSKDFAKNWQKPINKYLDDYLHHCADAHNVNFSEAAIILSNSSDVYKKRVDLLYHEFLDFIAHMNDGESRVGEDAEQQSATTKKKTRRLINGSQTDDVDVVDFINNEKTTVLNVLDVKKSGDRKKVVLNHFEKVPIKVSAAVSQVLTTNGKEIGSKDEFRLFRPVASTSLSCEHFHFTSQNLERFDSSFLDDSNGNNDDCLMNDDSFSVDNCIVDQQPSRDDLPDLGEIQPSSSASPPPLPSPEPQKSKKNEKAKKIIDIWERINPNLMVTLRKLDVKNVITLPKCIKDKEEEDNEQKKRKRNKKKENDQDITIGDLLYQDEILGDNCLGLKIKSKFAKKKRRDLVKARLKAEKHKDDGDESDYHDDNDDHFEADEVFDNDYEMPAEALNISELPGFRTDHDGIDEARSTYLDTAVQVLDIYRNEKREMCQRKNEIDKKVALWHESIKPALELAESRSIFDVKEYGTKILDRFPDNSKKKDIIVPFEQLVQNQPREEIGRFFLASLMLANTSNVEIIKSNCKELSTDCLQFRLLTKVRHQDLLYENIEATTTDSHH